MPIVGHIYFCYPPQKTYHFTVVMHGASNFQHSKHLPQESTTQEQRIGNTFPKNQQLKNRELETPSPRINNSRTENWKHLPQESTVQEQRMIVATIILYREKNVVIFYTGLDSCEENLNLTSNIRCLKPN